VKDPKTQLQEYLQAQRLSLPEYTLTQIIEHEQESIFYVKSSIKPLNQSAHGQGSTRRKAEQEAAAALLKLLKNSLNGE
jgi:ribonuclease-3